jgi:hypothetical protein
MVRMGGVGGPRATTNHHPEVVGSIPHVRIFFLFSLSLLFLRVRPNGTVVPRTWAFPCCRCFLLFSACHRRGKYRTPKQAFFGAKKGAQSASGHFFEHRPRARKRRRGSGDVFLIAAFASTKRQDRNRPCWRGISFQNIFVSPPLFYSKTGKIGLFLLVPPNERAPKTHTTKK